MIFSSLTFVIFYIILMSLFFLLKGDRARRYLLLIASYIFYGWWDPRFLLLIVGSSLWSWYFGNRIAVTEDERKRKIFLIFGLFGDLGTLCFFKYFNFFVDSFASLFGIENVGTLNIILPVGISFFTFQTMSYTIDVYRRNLPMCRSAEKWLLFVAFFPQLVAGPIVRASEFLPQLDRPITTNARNISLGLQVFLLGLVQKMVVADNLSLFVDPVFKDPALYDTATLWLAMVAYALQIFCDFSGYSTMAVGLAQTLGFQMPENFRTPYLSRSITEFWRRWHISLSNWLRDYLYISLGGNRKGKWRTDFNLIMTMFLGGLWHGAGWNFAFWGLAHGVALFIHKRFSRIKALEGLRKTAPYSVASFGLTLLFVMLLWIPFRASDFATTAAYLQGLFGLQDGIRWLHPQSLSLIGVMVVWHALHLGRGRKLMILPSERPFSWATLWTVGTLLLCLGLFAQLAASPFIYFQF